MATVGRLGNVSTHEILNINVAHLYVCIHISYEL